MDSAFTMLKTVRAQLALIFFLFLVLVAVSVGASVFAINAQAQDALVINLAGRQRMLSQRIIGLTSVAPKDPTIDRLAAQFDSNLHALRNGGEATDSYGRSVVLAAPTDEGVRVALDRALEEWEAFQAPLRQRDLPEMMVVSERLLASLDQAVTAFEQQAQAKIRRLRFIQLSFLGLALLLLGWGYVLVDRRIVQPLRQLSSAARRIGAGELDNAVSTGREDEIGDLAKGLDAMRAEILQAQKHLESEVEQRTSQLTTAFEFSQEIVTEFDLDVVLNSVVERARQLMEADKVTLCLLDGMGGVLNKSAVSIDTEAVLSEMPQPWQTPELGQFVQIAADNVEDACVQCAIIAGRPPGECTAVPLRIGIETLGALCLIRDPAGQLAPEEHKALSLLANAAALAIDNARMIEEKERRAEKAAASAEREQLAATLHDDLAQTLSFLRIKVEKLQAMDTKGTFGRQSREVLASMSAAISAAYKQLRGALTGLRWDSKTEDDLKSELEDLAATMLEDRGLQVKLTLNCEPGMKLGPVVRSQALHVVRESLKNVDRHARTRHAEVTVDRTDGYARFIVRDHGCGFDPRAVDRRAHLGLEIMETRTIRSGGTFSIHSEPDEGTAISAKFPVEAGARNERQQS